MSAYTYAPGMDQASFANRSSSSSLRLSRPGDALEQEADRVASTVVAGGRIPSWSIAHTNMGSVQRDTPDGADAQQQPAPKPNNYEDAAKKLGEAFAKTETGKKLVTAINHDPVVKGAKDFLTSLPGLVIVAAAADATLIYLAAENKPLPAQLPGIPLDKVHPALKGWKANITWQGPVLHPTKTMIGFSYSFGGDDKKKTKKDDSAKYAEEIKRAKAQMDAANAERSGSTYTGPSPYAPTVESFGQRPAFTPLPGTLGRPLVPDQKGAAVPSGSSPLPNLGIPWTPPSVAALSKLPDVKPADAAPKVSEDKDKKEPAAVQRKTSENAPSYADAGVVKQGLRSSTRLLDPETRRFMESRMGHDFGRVKIHSDADAAQSARSLGSLAYTVGDSVVFAEGKYSPRNTEGRRLLAHELTHVVQQTGAPAKTL